jgi:hypothetical protein
VDLECVIAGKGLSKVGLIHFSAFYVAKCGLLKGDRIIYVFLLFEIFILLFPVDFGM